MESILVSVICNAFNHEAYIRDALEGFVQQKTNFNYEILVHDDASTDLTADIIREYERKYPEIIKPIYETENQYSKRDGSLVRIQYGRARGKYIALCEGDDYWTDALKLQKQVDALELHPEIDICATGAKTEIDHTLSGQIAPSQTDTVFTAEDVIDGGGGFVATVSLMFRRSMLDAPLPFFTMLRLDYTYQILGSLKGGMLYLADHTCVYRVQTPGSWTCRTSGSVEAANRFQETLCNMLWCLDRDTEGKYHAVIERKINSQKFGGYFRNRDYKAMCMPEYRHLLMELPTSRHLMVRIGSHAPRMTNMLWGMARRVKTIVKR